MDRYFLVTLPRSTALNYVAYWTTGGVMEVGFWNGGVYEYRGVPLQIAVSLITAASAGAFFNAHIRNQFRG